MSAGESLARRISRRNREKKWRLFLERFQPTAATTVLDVGYTTPEHFATDNFIAKHYPHPGQLTSLGVDDPAELRAAYPKVRFVQYHGATFPFADNQFDVCWCNAVLEHVGDDAAQVRFLREIRRVARSAWVTTPNLHFPIELHTRTPLLHFLGRRIFDAYLRARGKDWAAGDYMHLLSRRGLQRLLDQAEVGECTLMRNRLWGFVMEFIVSWRKDAEQDAGRGQSHP